jgi:hypothetical protein
MLELNNYSIQNIENLTDLFTTVFVIIDDIYNETRPISIKNRRNIKDSKLSDSEYYKHHWRIANNRLRKIIFRPFKKRVF